MIKYFQPSQTFLVSATHSLREKACLWSLIYLVDKIWSIFQRVACLKDNLCLAFALIVINNKISFDSSGVKLVFKFSFTKTFQIYILKIAVVIPQKIGSNKNFTALGREKSR